MKRGGESRKEATPRINLLSTRTNTRFGTWNVRTMYEASKALQISREMEGYHLDILGLCETRWIQSGEQRLATGHTIIYSGHQDDNAHHTEGVGIMLSKLARKALIRWNPVGPRLNTAEFQTISKDINFHVIQAYAPTEDKDLETKETFYKRLQDVINKVRRKDIVIMMGDMNAKVGDNNRGFEEIMGVHGLGLMNENGELFANMCATNEIVIGGTVFPHKMCHKATWFSPDQRTENQIDHICINRKFRTSLLDVRAYRGADVGSDHHLVVAKIRLKLRKRPRNVCQRPRFNVAFLKDQTIRDRFNVEVKNRFQILENHDEEENTEEVDVEDHWSAVKTGWTDACQKVLGQRKPHHKPWITKKTLDLIEDRKKRKDTLNSSKTRAGKTRAQEEYSQAMKDVKTSVKDDKRSYTEELAKEAEEAAGSGNMARLYKITKQLTGKFRNSDAPVRNKQGVLLTSEEDQKKRWVEHFEELLNRPGPDECPEIPPAETLLVVDTSRPSVAEIENAITRLKNGKAPGPDGIPPEALRADVTTSANILYRLLGLVWDKEELPRDWREGYLVKLPKKGNLQECKNYRGIMLLSIPGKIMSRIILDRLKGAIDQHLREEQAGFRKGRSCADQIATLRIIVEQSVEWNSSLYVNFVDYEKAFDSLDRETLWKLMRHYGIPEKFVTMIQKMYEGMNCRVMMQGQLTESFTVKTGVRQGCLLSPFLFLLAMDWIMKTTNSGHRNGIQWTLTRQLEDLDFADDVALLSHSHKQMQTKMDRLSIVSNSTGLHIHSGKTKVLRINATDAPISLQGSPVEDVESFTYLGSVINKQGGVDEDIKIRIQKARAAFIMLRNIWRSRDLKMDTKLRIFQTNVKSILLYGAETWRLTQSAKRKLQSFSNGCLRRILGLKWYDFVSNENLLERTGERRVEIDVKQRRWRWIGHILRRPKDSIARIALNWNPQGKRKRGRPKATWRKEVEADVKRLGKSWSQLEKVAQDRPQWRRVVVGLCSLGS